MLRLFPPACPRPLASLALALVVSAAFAAQPPPVTITADTNGVRLAFPSTAAGIYRVQQSTDLANWQFAGQSLVATGPSIALTYPVNAPRSFWRVRAYDPDTAYDPGRATMTVAPLVDQVWTDPARGYAMPVRLQAPALANGTGPFPVVVLSHGLGGNRSAFDQLSSYLAGLGYICVTLTHDDTRPNSRLERPADVSFALDIILGAAPPSPLLSGRVDPARIAMVGHSFGAFTTLAIMGATYHESGLPGAPSVSLPDPRVRAGVPLSPQGPGVLGLDEHSWDTITRPVFTLRGTLDSSFETPDPATRDQPYQHMPAPNKYHGIVDGAEHSDFSDNGIAAHGDTYSRWYFPTIAAFLDAQLLDRATARDWLDAQSINRLSAGVLLLQGK